MRRLRAELARAAHISCPVLVTGEAGSGKSLAAKLLARSRQNRARTVFGVDFEARRPHTAEVVEDICDLSALARRRLCAWLDAHQIADPIATATCVPDELRHRFLGLEIRVPPLRERLEDLDELCAWFGGSATDDMRAHAWPGNVRELRNTIRAERSVDRTTPLGTTLRDAEAAHIERILRSVGWNKTRAAELLGIQRSTVYQKIKEHGLAPDSSDS